MDLIIDCYKAGFDSSKGTYSWKIPTDLTDSATFGFEISLDSKPSIFQYSFPFHITGGNQGLGRAFAQEADEPAREARGDVHGDRHCGVYGVGVRGFGDGAAVAQVAKRDAAAD